MLPFGIRWQGPPVFQPPIQPPIQVVDDEPHKCIAITKSDSRCKNAKMKNSSYCNIHHKTYNKQHKQQRDAL